MIEGIHFGTHGVNEIKTHCHMVRNQLFVHRHHKTRSLHPNHFSAPLPKMKHCLVIHTAKHVHLITHHSNTAFKVNISHQISNLIIRTIRPNTRKHGFFIGRIHKHLVLVTAENILIKMLKTIQFNQKKHLHLINKQKAIY